MYEEILTTLDLSPNEAKIYETLVEHGESPISKIAVTAQIHRRNAYDAINRLVDKGLIFQIFSGGDNRYNAVDPDKLQEILFEKQEKLSQIIPALKKKFQHREAPQEAYIYRGLEGQKNIWRDVLRIGQDSFFVGAKGGWFDPRLEQGRLAFFKEAKRKNIKFIQLFDYEKRGNIPNFSPSEIKYRFLPKEFSTSSAIHIFGDHVVTYTGMHINKLEENVVFFVIISKELANSYRTWFSFMWKKSTEK